jgi:hypothetical protein
MGEFDVYLLAKQYGVKDPPNYYRHWRGGYYFAAQAKNGPKDQIAMLYFSRWDSPEAAWQFARLYADYMPNRYPEKDKLLKEVSASCLETAATPEATPACSVISGSTSEGPYHIEWHGSDLLIMEGYDQSAMERSLQVAFYGMTLPVSGKNTPSK